MAAAQRVEVITSVQRRRRFTDDEKQRYIEETLAPGSSIGAVAERHGIDRRLLYMWKRKLKKSGALSLAATRVRPLDAAPTFTAVATLRDAAPATLRLWLGDVAMEIAADVCPQRLAALIAALRA